MQQGPCHTKPVGYCLRCPSLRPSGVGTGPHWPQGGGPRFGSHPCGTVKGVKACLCHAGLGRDVCLVESWAARQRL